MRKYRVAVIYWNHIPRPPTNTRGRRKGGDTISRNTSNTLITIVKHKSKIPFPFYMRKAKFPMGSRRIQAYPRRLIRRKRGPREVIPHPTASTHCRLGRDTSILIAGHRDCESRILFFHIFRKKRSRLHSERFKSLPTSLYLQVSTCHQLPLIATNCD